MQARKANERRHGRRNPPEAEVDYVANAVGAVAHLAHRIMSFAYRGFKVSNCAGRPSRGLCRGCERGDAAAVDLTVDHAYISKAVVWGGYRRDII